MNYRFLSPAKSELIEAIEFYEKAVPGLGLEFLDEVERTIARIDRHPEAWNPISENRNYPGILSNDPQGCFNDNILRNCRREFIPRGS